MNQISMPKAQTNLIEPLRLKNQSTSVFIEILVLSGSKLAKTNREKEFIIWLAQRDQNIVGHGTVGFDMDEMPWLEEDFSEMKVFLFKCIEGAIHRTNWHLLDYEPNEEWVKRIFEHFRSMILFFDEKYINWNFYYEWALEEDDDDTPTIPAGYPRCLEHSVLLSCHGCIICNSKLG